MGNLGPNISISELMGALQKSGLPMGGGSGVDAQNAASFSRDAIAPNVPGQDQVNQLGTAHKSALDQIAQMDQKLHQLYTDPSSPLHMEDPGKALRYSSQAYSQGSRAAGNIATTQTNAQKNVDSNITKAVDLYSKIATLQAREDKRSAKIGKAGVTSQTKADKANQKALDAHKKLTGETVLNNAGISDKGAGDTFLNTPAAFQKQFIRDYQIQPQVGRSAKAGAGGFTSQEVNQAYDQWQKTFKPKKTGADKIQALKDAIK